MDFDIPEIGHLYKVDVVNEQRASDVMNRAYAEYPLIYPLFRKKENWSAVCDLFLLECRCSDDILSLSTSEDIRSLAMFVPPGHKSPSFAGYLKGGVLGISKNFKLGRLLKYESFCEEVRKRHASPDSWYLFNLVVDPVHQGKGESSALLKPMLSYLDRIGKECYLETHDEKNIPLYEHFGFELVETPEVFPGLTHYAMLRKPIF